MGRPRKERKNWDELGTLWEVSDELWAQIAPVVAEVDPPKASGRPRIDARRAQCDPVPAEERLPMEPFARALSRRQLSASHLPALGAPGPVRTHLGRAGRAVRRVGRGELGVAGGRRGDGQGAAGGTSSGATPPIAANGE